VARASTPTPTLTLTLALALSITLTLTLTLTRTLTRTLGARLNLLLQLRWGLHVFPALRRWQRHASLHASLGLDGAHKG